MKTLATVFTLKSVGDIATKLGFNTPMLEHSNEEIEMYNKTFELEVIEKSLPEGQAKMEVAFYNGEKIAAVAWLNGREMIVPPLAIESMYNDLKSK